MNDPPSDPVFLSPRETQDECLAVSNPRSRTSSDVYPVTIIAARYSGAYEGGRYCAFNGYPEDIPRDAIDNDVTCCIYWGSEAVNLVGRGSTPDRALADLRARLEKSR